MLFKKSSNIIILLIIVIAIIITLYILMKPVEKFADIVVESQPIDTLAQTQSQTVPIDTLAQTQTQTVPIDTLAQTQTQTVPIDTLAQTQTVPINTLAQTQLQTQTQTVPIDTLSQTQLQTQTIPTEVPIEVPTITPPTSNTINNSSLDVITTPPPSLHTPSVNEMNSMGLYSFGNKNPSSGITQIGGEGPNNYFQPNIIIRRKQDNQEANSKYRVEFGVGNELKPFLPMAKKLMNQQPQMQYQNQNEQNQSMDFSYGSDSGYNLNGYDNDPFNTAPKNAQSSFLKDNSKIGVGSTTCKDCGETNQEKFYNNEGDTDLSRNSNLSTSLDSNYRTIDKTTNYNMQNNSSTFTHNCKMKEFLPGYQIQAPKCWDVPQQRPPVCIQNNKQLPSAVFDRGTPLNALNLDTQVGSIMPKFKYSEERR